MDKTKIAIIQLTRIGDIIQTTQAARQMKAESPDAHLTLIARRKFAKGLMFLLETVFDNIILFDTADFFIQKSLKSGKAEVSSFIKQLKSEKFEFTILTHAIKRGHMTRQVSGRKRCKRWKARKLVEALRAFFHFRKNSGPPGRSGATAQVR